MGGNQKSGQARILIDPLDAFFFGLSSALARAFFFCLAAFLAFFLHAAVHQGAGLSPLFFPFAALFQIFSWAALGGWFVIGLAALVAALVTGFRFVRDEGGRVSWFAVFALFTLYFLPLSFTRSTLSNGGKTGELIEVRPWMPLALLFAAITVVYWLVPGWIARMLQRDRGAEPAQGAEEPEQADQEAAEDAESASEKTENPPLPERLLRAAQECRLRGRGTSP